MKKIISYFAGAGLALALALAPVLAITDTTAPSAPSALSATATSTSQINLAWTASTDDVAVAAYIIFRNSSPVGFATTNSFSDTGLSPATAYSYTVKALDTSGNYSAYSNVATTTTLTATADTIAPSAPSALSATAISASQINLSWTAATDNVAVASYLIFRDGSPIGTSLTTAFSDTGLTAATAHNYTVQALDTSGNVSAYSNIAAATTLNTTTTTDTVAPSAPTGLSASVISDRQINLSWTASTDNVGVTGYVILRNGLQVGTSPTTAFSDTGLTANTAYSYTVKALDAAGNASGESVSVSATTLPANYKNRGHHDDDEEEDEDEDEYEEEYEHEDASGHEHSHIHRHGQGHAYGLTKHHDD